MMNSWKTLLKSYQQKMYKNTLGTVNRQIQQAINPMPVTVISLDAERVDNAILPGYLTSKVVLVDAVNGSTDRRKPGKQQLYT
jgi:hypothetical protein